MKDAQFQMRALAVVAFAIAAVLNAPPFFLRLRGVSVEARVGAVESRVETHETRDRRGRARSHQERVCSAELQYFSREANPLPYTTTVPRCLQTGDTVTVIYPRGRPERGQLSDAAKPNRLGLLVALIGLLLFFASPSKA